MQRFIYLLSKVKLYHIWVVLLIPVWISCTDSSTPLLKNAAESCTVISAPTDSIPSKISAIYDFEQYILLDTSAFLGSVSKVIYTDRYIVVGDFRNTKDIYLYQHNGQLVSRLYLNQDYKISMIHDFAIDQEDHLYVLMDNPTVVHVFNKTGQLLREIPIPLNGMKIQVTITGDLLIHGVGSGNNDVTQLVLLDKKGRLKYTPALFPSLAQFPVPGISNLNHTAKSDHFLFGEMLNDTLYEASPEGVQPKWVLNMGLHHISDKKPLRKLPYDQIMTALNNQHMASGADMLYETENCIHCCVLHENVLKTVLYFKNSGQTVMITPKSDDLFGGFFGHIPYAALPADRLLFILEPMALHNSGALPDGTHPILTEIKSKTTRLSNPVLLIGKIKHLPSAI